MVYKVVIKDNKNSPIRYLPDLENFKNGREYIFKPGVNIIVGENGCGKTTLMNLIKKYLLVDYQECSCGKYNSNINALFRDFLNSDKMQDGVEVYADYQRNTFRLCHAGEKRGDDLDTFRDFGTFFNQNQASTGEGVKIALQSLFALMYGKNANLLFDYKQFKRSHPVYWDYIKEHHKDGDEWTILMDEPDRNLSIENLNQIKSILSFHKERTQIIAVVHNPLLIYNLSKKGDINIIEMTDGYVHKVNSIIRTLVK